MKAYLIASAVLAVAAVALAVAGFSAFAVSSCVAVSLASLLAYKAESGIAAENEEFNRWRR